MAGALSPPRRVARAPADRKTSEEELRCQPSAQPGPAGATPPGPGCALLRVAYSRYRFPFRRALLAPDPRLC
jgi:hypothetical protein